MPLKTPTKTQIPSNDMTYIQHQIDRLRQEKEKNDAENNEFRKLIKKNLSEERVLKREEAEIELPFSKKETNVLKTRLKPTKRNRNDNLER